jgi:hypothetical protein
METPDGYTVVLKDGFERTILATDSAGNVALPAGLTLGTGVLAPTHYADVEFDAAAVKLLNTPATLVASPGAGLALIFEGAVMFYDYVSAAFTIGSATGLGIRYTDGSGLQVGQSLVTGFLDQTADKLRWVNRYAAASGDSSVAPVADAPLVLQMLTANVSGAAVATLSVRTYYRIVPATL